MSQHDPNINFSQREEIANGVIVNTIKQFEKSDIPFKATVFTIAPGEITPLDQHQVQECWIIMDGVGQLTHQGQHHEAKHKDIFYFQSYEPHQIKNTGSTTLTICSIYW